MKKNNNNLVEDYSTNWTNDSIRLFPITSDQDKNLFLYVQELGYFKTTPGYYTRRKNLNSFLILTTVRGEGILKYNNKSYSLESGSTFIIDCKELHEYSSTSKTDWEFYWVHFEGVLATGYYQKLMAK